MSFSSVLRWGALGLLTGIVTGVLTNDITMPAMVRWHWFDTAASVALWGPAPVGMILMFALDLRSKSSLTTAAIAGLAFTIGSVITANDGSSYPLNPYMIVAIAITGAPVILLALAVGYAAAVGVKRYILKRASTTVEVSPRRRP